MALDWLYGMAPGQVRMGRFSMLKSVRLWRGSTQQELADAVGASRTTVSRLERRLAIPSVSLALALARRLDVTVEDLFSSDDLR
jgi:putative transcriptional regulator